MRDDLDYLVQAAEDSEFREPEAPSKSPRRTSGKAWRPKMGPIGLKVLRDSAKYILMAGERGSTKTNIATNKVILECYENPAALGMMVSLTRSSSTEGGAWEKLNSLNLPEWRDGIGLDFTEPKMDDQKNRYIFISNKYGGWSKIMLRSMPFGSMISSRIKGMEPSIFFFNELTEAESPEYFTKPIQQLGRRPGIKRQQYIADCNPADSGEAHWVYQKFFMDPVDPVTGVVDPNFSVYHVPMSENVFWSREEVIDYQSRLLIEARGDPSAAERLIHGKWIARQVGDGLFAEYFVENIHCLGNALTGEGIQPIPGYPIFVGYDLGQVYSSVTFMQFLPAKEKSFWIVFDELDFLGKKILYKNLAQNVVQRMNFWKERAGYPFKFVHISDESAINNWRPGGEGSYDSWDMERYSDGAIKMIGCPKGKGSVPARVRIVASKLIQEELYISATCPNTVDMLKQLKADKLDPAVPMRSKWLHKFDSLSYVLFKTEAHGVRGMLPRESRPSLIRCGGG